MGTPLRFGLAIFVVAVLTLNQSLNARATYQRAATMILPNMLHKEVEVYMDDMIV